MPAGCLALFVLMLFFVFVPFFMANIALAALARLGLSFEFAFLVIFGMLLGSMVNIPVKTIEHEHSVRIVGAGMFGFGGLFPQLVKQRSYTVIAVNVGGCLIPVALALYQLIRISQLGPGAILITLAAIGANVWVCYRIARPVPGVGIAMRPLIPGLLAALSALLLMPGFAPPVAFSAGVLGPLIGADLLHLKDITRSPTGIASIGGAGTFDGIVITGLIALLLA